MAAAEPCCSFCKLPRSKVKNARLFPSKLKTELDTKICMQCVEDCMEIITNDTPPEPLRA